MKTNPKVVSFERSAAYVHHRAMKNRRDNNLVDALELMRHAVEQSPENDDYLLDLAELYCEMGCHAQSMRILLDRLSRPNAPSECYYGLALNQLGLNELDAARRALRMYQMRNGDSEYMEDAINLQNEIDFFEDFNRTCDRRRLRAIKIAGKACQAVREERPDRAVRLFERSLSLDSDQPEMRAMYAVALKLAGDGEGALKNAQMCVEGDASVRALCTAAQAFNMCGMADRAAEIIRCAAAMECDENEFQLLMLMMGELRMDRDAAEKLRLYLQAFPHSRELMHMRAVALHRCGAPDAQAAAFWKRILRIDPDDTVAQFYADAAAAGTLSQNEPEYTYEVPDAEYRRRLSVIAEALAGGTEGIAERWRQDRAFRNLLIWAVSTGNVSCCRAAMILIASAGDADAVSTLREIMYRGGVPVEAKLHALLFLRLRGAETAGLLSPDADARDGLLPEADSLLEEMPVGERQLVRLAADILEAEYDVSAEAALALMWRVYRERVRAWNDVLICTEEAAGALAWNYLMRHGKYPNPGTLAEQFGCRIRRLTFYARRMAAALSDFEVDTNEDH